MKGDQLSINHGKEGMGVNRWERREKNEPIIPRMAPGKVNTRKSQNLKK